MTDDGVQLCPSGEIPVVCAPCESPPSTSAWMDWAVALSMRMVYGLMFRASARSERKFEMKRFFFFSLAMSDWSAAIEKVASTKVSAPPETGGGGAIGLEPPEA